MSGVSLRGRFAAALFLSFPACGRGGANGLARRVCDIRRPCRACHRAFLLVRNLRVPGQTCPSDIPLTSITAASRKRATHYLSNSGAARCGSGRHPAICHDAEEGQGARCGLESPVGKDRVNAGFSGLRVRLPVGWISAWRFPRPVSLQSPRPLCVTLHR